jgi:hypothetical protein
MKGDAANCCGLMQTGQSHPLTNQPPWAENRPGEPAAAQRDEIRKELGRIVASARFRSSLRLTGFITFVVEATLAGGAGKIKGYTIAIGALGRGSDFDPQTDAIVRVEAGRLRQALARYYAGEGSDDPLVIDIPRGTYVPTFRHRELATAQQSGQPSGDAPILVELNGGSKRRAEINGGRQQFVVLLSEFQDLMQIHLLQVSALTAEIASTLLTLRSSRALLQVADNSAFACRPALPLLPTAPSSQSGAARAANGRQDQQAQGTPPAGARRSRPSRDRRDTANDGDDPGGL